MGQGFAFPKALLTHHEGQFVAAVDQVRDHHRATNRDTELIALKRRNGCSIQVEIVFAIKFGIAQQLNITGSPFPSRAYTPALLTGVLVSGVPLNFTVALRPRADNSVHRYGWPGTCASRDFHDTA